MPVEVDVALGVDDAVMQGVDLGDEGRERLPIALGGEEIPRRPVEVPPRLRVDLVAEVKACRLRSSKSVKDLPARKLPSMKRKGRSTRAERLASPFSCARKTKPKRSAKAAISGAGTISRPVPEATTRWVLSIMQTAAAPWRYVRASVKKTLQWNRLKTG